MTEEIFFEGRIKEIEQEINDYYLDLAQANSQNTSLQKILSALMLHEKLTQFQIKQLTNLSKSTISTGLSNLANIGFIKKTKIAGSREYLYIVSPSYIDSLSNALGNLENEIHFFNQKFEELKTNFDSSNNGFSLLTTQLEELITVFDLYQQITDQIGAEKIIFEYNEPDPPLTSQDILNIEIGFHPKIKRIEDEIIDFFVYHSVYSAMEEWSLRVYVYFMTRKVLNQQKLRDLTGLSLGKISQLVNKLVEQQVIELVDKKKYKKIIPDSKKRQQLYSIESNRKSFFRSGLNASHTILKYASRFKELRDELIQNESILKNLNGYANVLEAFNTYFKLIRVFRKIEPIYKELSQRT